MDEWSRPELSVVNPWYTFDDSGQVITTQLPKKNWDFIK